MRNSYKLRVRAVHQDQGGDARVLLSGTDIRTGSCWAVLLIVDTQAFEKTCVPILDEEYVIQLSPAPEREGRRVKA